MKWYGFLGIVIMLLVEVNFYLQVEPFASLYFPFAWFGLILFLDALVFKFHKKSLLHNNRKKFIFLLVSSALFWWLFEALNMGIINWTYHGGMPHRSFFGMVVFRTISFSTVLPAVFEVAELLRVKKFFMKMQHPQKRKVPADILYGMIIIGIITLILPLVWPQYFFPLVWITFFFLFDPVNYMHGQHSIVGSVFQKKFALPLTLAVAGGICGFFWEFWNYWAVRKWVYHIPFVGFVKIFEMPLLGYLGYIPFAFELFAMYHLVIYYVRNGRLMKKN